MLFRISLRNIAPVQEKMEFDGIASLRGTVTIIYLNYNYIN